MNVFELVGTFVIEGVDAAKAKIKSTTSEAKTGFGETEAAAEKSSSKLSSVLGKVGGTLGKVAKVGIGALMVSSTVAFGALSMVAKGALEAYASYEQLVGGVETLFGSSAGVVESYAANAYKTAGMSANAYMETVTSFSASLLQGLGGDTAAAAEYANTAVTDMSDNANKMGTNISTIQDAYQGFAKQNYTMLDNLKLGYGGTQGEMARLINDSGVLGDSMTVTAETVNQVSFDKMIEAIHSVQTEMGITGTTALEASSTIEGSVSSAKAAWENWLVGLADDNANVTELTNQLVESVGTAASNIIPRIALILTTLGTAIMQNLPMILEQVRLFFETYGPTLLAAAASLFSMIVQALIQNAPGLISYLLDMLNQLVQYLIANMPAILDGALTLFGGILAALGQAAPQILVGLVQLLVSLIVAIGNKVGEMIAKGAEFLGGLVSGFGNVDVEGAIDGVIGSIVGAFGGAGQWLVDAGASMLRGLWGGIEGGLGWLGGKLAGIGEFIIQHKGPPAKDAVLLEDNGSLIMGSLIRGLNNEIPALQKTLNGIAGQISIGGSVGVGMSASRATSMGTASGRSEQLLEAVLSTLQAFAAKYEPASLCIDGDELVGATSKRMERSFVKRGQLSGGIA